MKMQHHNILDVIDHPLALDRLNTFVEQTKAFINEVEDALLNQPLSDEDEQIALRQLDVLVYLKVQLVEQIRQYKYLYN